MTDFTKFSFFLQLLQEGRQQKWGKLYVIIMSRTSFRVNLHSVVCLNVKEFLAWRRHHIWSLSYNSGIRTHNHLVGKWTLNYLAKLASLVKWFTIIRLRIKWLWARIPLLSLKWGKLFACFESTNNFWY